MSKDNISEYSISNLMIYQDKSSIYQHDIELLKIVTKYFLFKPIDPGSFFRVTIDIFNIIFISYDLFDVKYVS